MVQLVESLTAAVATVTAGNNPTVINQDAAHRELPHIKGQPSLGKRLFHEPVVVDCGWLLFLH
jgi:hypothetical protein